MGSKTSVSNFAAVTYSLHRCWVVQWNYTTLKYSSPFTCCRIPAQNKKNLPPGYLHLILVDFSLWEFFCKNYRQKTETLIIAIWSAFFVVVDHVLDPISRDTKRAPDQLPKWATMIIMIYSRHDEFLSTYICSQAALIVNFKGITCNNRTLFSI